MAEDLNIAVEIAATDKASETIGKIGKGLTGIGSVGQAAWQKVGGFADTVRTLSLAGFGVSELADKVQGFFQDATDAQTVATQTAAAIKSTGGAAGLSADQVAGYATQFSKVTPFEDEAVQSGENILLTFTNIGKNVFPQATETALDMSTALGQDMKDGAIQLGKALNDPITGMSALQRVGVTFTDQQKAQITALQKSGQMEKAQGVILQELQKEFGGSAKAAGETFAGKLKIAETQVGNIKEAIGGPLIGVFGDLLTAVTPAITAFAQNLPNALAGLSGKVQGVLQFLQPMATWIVGTLVPGVMSLAQNIASFLGPVLSTLASNFSAAFGALKSGNISGFITGILSSIGNLRTNLVGALAGLAQEFVNWIGPMIPPMLAKLAEVGKGILSWLAAQVPIYLAQLGAWASAFIAWVEPLIPPLLAKLGQLASQLFTWVQAQIPVWIAQLEAWAKAFIDWVLPMIPPLIAKLQMVATKILDWLSANAPGLAQKLLSEWLPAFLVWLVQAAIQIIPKLAQLLLTITVWIITTAVPKILVFAFKMGVAIVTGILSGLANLAGALMSAIGTALSQVHIDIGPFHLSAAGFRIDAPSMPSVHLLGYASGTSFAPGGLALVGERGPEIVSLPRGSRVTPNNQIGGGDTILQFYGPVYGFDDFQDQVIAALEQGKQRMRKVG